MKRMVHLGTESYSVELMRRGENATLCVADRTQECSIQRVSTGEYRLTLGGESHPLWVAHDRDTTYVHAFGRAWEIGVSNPAEMRAEASQATASAATAPMPGMVVSVLVAPGDVVEKGQPMVVIESMKMQSEISARRAGTVEAVLVALGESFERGAPLVALTAEE